MESNLTPSSSQDSTTNSQSTRSKIDPTWEHVSKERYANGRKSLICLHCKKIAKGGAIALGYKGPNYHQLRVNLLKDAKKEVQLLMDSYRAIWAKVGCTIMDDGWTDNRQRTLINFLVYCPEGILFVKFVDVSFIVKDVTNLFLLFDEDISKMDHVAELVRRASKVTTFVYNHVTLLSWLRKRDGWTEILRPGATRFATTFIALKNLNDHKHDLQALVTSMYRVRLGTKKLFNYSKRLYKPYTEIIKQCWDQQLKKSIHAAAYWLNPCFQYDQENFRNKPTVIGGVMDVIDQKVLKGKFEIMNEMKLFRDRLGSFGRDLAYSSREANWWLCRDGQAALKQFSHAPYLELKLPPPLCCAYSEITARAQTSQVLAISPSDMGCDRLRSEMLNLDLAFTERSSYSLLSKECHTKFIAPPGGKQTAAEDGAGILMKLRIEREGKNFYFYFLQGIKPCDLICFNSEYVKGVLYES
uniref:DUF659 domain-containing protein n=1 Tax=Vitis vinifera TaxID=29760 RepID=A5B7P2_VITVI|nr:hypothetical protein VITISV_039412 [Vitis vinifera]